ADPELVETPGMHTVVQVADFLQIPPRKVIKTLLYAADGQPAAALIPGDRELNEVKLKNHLQVTELNLASPEQVREWTGAEVGFAGPRDLGIKAIIADNLLSRETDLVAGANQSDMHLRHVDLARDVPVQEYADLVNITETDPCPECEADISFYKGIEVGHIFKLGAKYSRAMEAVFLDDQGHEQEMIMGCYGIGVGRLLAAAIEQNHDENGIIFPPSISPFELVIIAVNAKDERVLGKAEELYALIKDLDIDVLLDDREERPGFKFKDADLAGYSMQLIVGARGIEKNLVEAKDRRTGERIELPLEGFTAAFQDFRSRVWQGWGLLD
ncbi:MAG: proline--tRNA ligase, partial [Desulfohalobiaceae bacterium]|nr:proline--tRNA ligase [Desulfohalobiaceae bacterium]